MLLMWAGQRRQELVVLEFQGELFGLGLAGHRLGARAQTSVPFKLLAVSASIRTGRIVPIMDDGASTWTGLRCGVRPTIWVTPRPGFSNSTSRVLPIAAAFAASCCDSSNFCNTSSRALF